ncbi:outer membrane-stress sensor serine endopeptidase DegS [Celerinatantimonas sp. MCCC 1A17872]|uniref:outer membrane-stress sensor serine endopeptidase DegS n=1 Tax=Celerinatantimonas sp. MCCC 1A17872 TaxID=3177514 RepID=UPI0038C93806
MIKYLAKSIVLGLTIAVIFLFVVPNAQKSSSLLHWPNKQQEKPMSFAKAARLASPAVVNIYTRSFSTSHLDNNPPSVTSEGLGSGVIMNKQGYILTNMHVIANADQIIVALQDGRVFIAELVGSDAITDLAVLKIDAGTSALPVIPQSNQLHTQVGDVVLAIGNPYNVGQTVTQGIISATGRSGMSASGRQDFLQTDAAINRGNSGGALVNSLGQLVGINTAAYHLGRNSETYGISFAIPYPLAKRILESLIRYGKIVRGYVGVDAINVRHVNPKQLEKLGIKNRHGLYVEKVDPKGPAGKAGLKTHDVILKMDNRAVESVKDAMDFVAETKPGTIITLTIIRNNKQQQLNVKVTELKVNQVRQTD